MNRTIISIEVQDDGRKERKKFTLDDYREFYHKYFPAQSNDIIENNWKAIQSLPKGTIIRLPEIEGCPIGSFEVY